MKEVERKDLPEITGGQVDGANVTIIPPITNTPTLPQPGSIDPNDPLGEGRPRHIEL